MVQKITLIVSTGYHKDNMPLVYFGECCARWRHYSHVDDDSLQQLLRPQLLGPFRIAPRPRATLWWTTERARGDGLADLDTQPRSVRWPMIDWERTLPSRLPTIVSKSTVFCCRSLPSTVTVARDSASSSSFLLAACFSFSNSRSISNRRA